MLEIRKGSTGLDVRVLQYLLGVKADGIFGPITEQAVRDFQNRVGIKVDGICGPITWGKLAEAQRTIKAGPLNKNGETTVGSKGDDVKAVQELVFTGVDGKFGQKTDAAVRAVQKASGLTVDGIVGPKTWKYLLTEYKYDAEPETESSSKVPVLYAQGDPRWAKYPYTSCGDPKQTMKSSGCGPTVAAMIVATWVDPKVIPPDMADLAVKNGYRTKNSGTAYAFFPFVAKKYGLKCTQYSGKYGFEPMRKALVKGALVVCCMGPGYFTTGGHFVLAWGDDGKYIYVNNPGTTSRNKAKHKVFQEETKAYFIFTKN